MKQVLFVCVHNAGRSQMAEAFFNRLANGMARATSAGTQPAKAINPTVVRAMREVGIDISRRRPKLLTLEMMEKSAKVISMGCGVETSCPAGIVPMEDWEIDDPEGKPIGLVRKIRDEIKARVEKLLQDEAGTKD